MGTTLGAPPRKLFLLGALIPWVGCKVPDPGLLKISAENL